MLHRYHSRGYTWLRRKQRAAYWGYRRQLLAQLTTEPVRHHGAIAHAGGIYLLWIYLVGARQLLDELPDKCYIINVMLHGKVAARACIPGPDA